MMNEKMFTAGVFAKKAGTTIRTIRHYDEIGLLKPTKINEKGYRMYSQKDLWKIQRIITLKSLGYSLEQIKKITEDNLSKEMLSEALSNQEQSIKEQLHELSRMMEAVKEAKKMLRMNTEIPWEQLSSVMDVLDIQEIFDQGFRTGDRLSTRITLHEKYSTSEIEWFHWVYDKMKLQEGCKVLELGCGKGTLWSKNKNRVPKECSITMVDKSQGILEECKINLKQIKQVCDYIESDIRSLPFEENTFDVVIANHVLYFIKDIDEAMREIRRVLKPGGILYASTFGKGNFGEVDRVLKDLDPRIMLSRIQLINSFYLDDGEEVLRRWFDRVEMNRLDDSLEVTSSSDLVQYVTSTAGNVQEILGKKGLEEFENIIREEIEKKGCFYINKDHGIFKAVKAIQIN